MISKFKGAEIYYYYRSCSCSISLILSSYHLPRDLLLFFTLLNPKVSVPAHHFLLMTLKSLLFSKNNQSNQKRISTYSHLSSFLYLQQQALPSLILLFMDSPFTYARPALCLQPLPLSTQTYNVSNYLPSISLQIYCTVVPSLKNTPLALHSLPVAFSSLYHYLLCSCQCRTVKGHQ